MSRKIMGVTVGTPTSPSKMASEITPAEIGAAPAGFGLGIVTGHLPLKTREEVDSHLPAGWYEYYNGDVACCGYPGTEYGGILVVPSMYQTTQYFFCRLYYGCVLKRLVGQPWEWVNPPMILGVEYRTTERWKMKAVYTKLVDCGVLPNETLKRVNHGAMATQMLRCVGQSTSDLFSDSLPYWYSDTDYCTVYASTTQIIFLSGKDLSDRTATAQIWYTKD